MGLAREPALANATRKMVSNTVEVLERLIDFPILGSALNPEPWERFSNTRLLQNVKRDGRQAAEVDLYPLIRDAVGHCATPAIMGKQFLEDHPHALEYLNSFDHGFVSLMSRIPSWTPIPAIRRAVKARRGVTQDLHAWILDFKKSLNDNVEGKDFSDVSEIIEQVVKM